ncbi:NUDIX domain-containing protein [Rhodococcus sp. NPDC003382]
MAVTSAGLLLYRIDPSDLLTVWLVHPGGPFWKGKDEAAWSIPKGEYTADEDPLVVALREFEEECGFPAPEVSTSLLGRFRQPSGKVVTVYVGEADEDAEGFAFVRSNTFELEWPPRSGRLQEFPEVDDARWVTLPVAESALVKGQRPILGALREYLDEAGRVYRTD